MICGVGEPLAEHDRLVGRPLSVVCFINDDVRTGGVSVGRGTGGRAESAVFMERPVGRQVQFLSAGSAKGRSNV